MTRRGLIAVAMLVLGFVGGSLATAQGVIAIRPPVQTVAVKPLVASGADIGFRIEARHGLTPIGKLVVRTDGGPWFDVEYITPEITAQIAAAPH